MRAFWKAGTGSDADNVAKPATYSDFSEVEAQRQPGTTGQQGNPSTTTENEHIHLLPGFFRRSNPQAEQTSDELRLEPSVGDRSQSQLSSFPRRTTSRLNSDYGNDDNLEINSYSGNIPPERLPLLERGLVRKLDLIILPLTMFLYLFSFLDKSVPHLPYLTIE